MDKLEIKFVYKGKEYNSFKLKHIIDRYDDIKNQLNNLGMSICPLCGQIVENDDICKEHSALEPCKECCPLCHEEECYSDYLNSKNDEIRGK